MRCAYRCAWLASAVAIVLTAGSAAAAESAVAERPGTAAAARSPADRLAAELAPLWECVSGARDAFSVEGVVSFESGSPSSAGALTDGRPSQTPPGEAGQSGSSPKKKHKKRDRKAARERDQRAVQSVDVRFHRHASDSFTLAVAHPDYEFEVRRRPESTSVALPRHGVVYVASGESAREDSLDPDGLLSRLVSGDSAVAAALPFLAQPSPALVAGFATAAMGLAPAADGSWRKGEATRFSIDAAGTAVTARAGGIAVDLTIGPGLHAPAADDWPGLERRNIPRDDLERMLVRGVRRGSELLAPGAALVAPEQVDREVPHGRLRWIEGQRVVTLWGTPEQIGKAHGDLLTTEALRCMDSVLHVVGLAELARSGEWFPARLQAAHERLKPHIPERHVRETRALAAAMRVEPDVIEIVNVFPELFHCSGFAVTGPATADGTLYHGRVLDYMTRIGLQDSAATLVVAPEGMIPFATVGYAGFIGSVSGMNDRGISLGEMGGQGEGDWDGVPMATLMRRALEECETLDDVIDLWKRSPRTCEYYYVFADGKSRRAVGVAATPTSLELVNLGDPHPLLGSGIPGAVVLSKDDRLACLRQRIGDGHGTIDEAAAIRLMDRPVAAASNLHNVLFVPERLVFHVANASHRAPAAECPSVRHDLRQLLDSIPRERDEAAGRARLEAAYVTRDSLAPPPEAEPDARDCLEGLVWKPDEFTVRVEASRDGNGDATLRFPSPRPGGDPRNDDVSVEWYHAAGDDPDARRPACVVVHESGSKMPFGRLIARGLAAHGIHAAMVHLPYYGLRRHTGAKPAPVAMIGAVRQAVADVRRARDAVAVLPCVDDRRIGVQGTSLGGFVAATAAAVDDGFSSTFIMLAGGDIAGVLADGRRDAAKLRERLVASGMTAEDIRSTVRAIEPLRLAHRLAPDRTWLYSARHDDVVPARNAELLAGAAGLDPSHHLQFHADHFTGIVYLPIILAQVAERLATPAP